MLRVVVDICLNLNLFLSKNYQCDPKNEGSRIPSNHKEFNMFSDILVLQLCKNYVRIFEAVYRPETQYKSDINTAH